MIRNGARSAALLLMILVGRPGAFLTSSGGAEASTCGGWSASPAEIGRCGVIATFDGAADFSLTATYDALADLRVTASGQTNLAGKWSASFDTQIGRQDYTYQFQLNKEKLTGRASSVNGESDIRNGKVEGDKVTFVEDFRYQGMTIVIIYSGTIVSRDEIRFTRQVGEFATEELVARRIEP